ncbi:hypothetical protein M413DRAFT_447899 [Hebeloma cylindrosporum]|uniref:Uncharacterized protein n=1 Tax=Hebeloma cylindrosporum TaxID=76867 RepID=A0A0C3C3I2_HEBCY|nr:hypothetical protein M413DRAFT_447899 [Hebeloma cylindrosporum h7]
MKLTISTLLLLPFSALAAECGHKFMGKPDPQTLGRFWTSRESVCNCIATQTGYCSGDISFLTIAVWGKLPSEQLCWDATADIINQCIANGEFLFRWGRMGIRGLIMGIGWNSGLYQFDGSTFQITRKK